MSSTRDPANSSTYPVRMVSFGYGIENSCTACRSRNERGASCSRSPELRGAHRRAYRHWLACAFIGARMAAGTHRLPRRGHPGFPHTKAITILQNWAGAKPARTGSLQAKWNTPHEPLSGSRCNSLTAATQPSSAHSARIGFRLHFLRKSKRAPWKKQAGHRNWW